MNLENHLPLPYRPNAGLVVLNHDGLVFAGQRLDTDYDAWQMPQGGIDEGEDAKSAALRELEEETGIVSNKVSFIEQTADWLTYDFPPELVGQLCGGKYRGQKQHWFLFRFLGDDTDININTKEPEFSVWKWIEPEKLMDKIVPFKRDVYRQVFEGFKQHL